MGICPSSIDVLLGSGEGIWPSPFQSCCHEQAGPSTTTLLCSRSGSKIRHVSVIISAAACGSDDQNLKNPQMKLRSPSLLCSDEVVFLASTDGELQMMTKDDDT